MTTREFYVGIANAEVSPEITEFANAAIAKLDSRNAKKATTLTKNQIANLEVKTKITDYLETVPNAVASEIGSACGISTQKASALCKALVEEKIVSVSDLKVKGKGTIKSYTLIVDTDSDSDSE